MILRAIVIMFVLVLLLTANAFALDLTFTDTYSEDGSSTSDTVTWGGYSIYSKANNINGNADCLCWDWCDNGVNDYTFSNWDTCNCKTAQAQTDCKAASAWVNTICNRGDCSIAALGANHDINPGSDGDQWTCQHDVREYRNCAGAVEIYNYEGQQGKAYYVINAKKYDCNDQSVYALEGKFGAEDWKWVRYRQDLACGASLSCDENHDDVLVNTAAGSISSVCKTISWSNCNVGSDCISDYCTGECSPCNSGNQCTSEVWNQCYNNGARCCSGDAINYQYFCKNDETWDQCTAGKDGQQQGNYVCSNAAGAWH